MSSGFGHQPWIHAMYPQIYVVVDRQESSGSGRTYLIGSINSHSLGILAHLLRMASWNLNEPTRFGGDCTPQSSSENMTGFVGDYFHIIGDKLINPIP